MSVGFVAILVFFSFARIRQVDGVANEEVERRSVVIVGVGAADIAAAARLYKNGIVNIVVLEAEHQIGGRIYTVIVENGVLELGAKWIHEEENNVVYKVVAT